MRISPLNRILLLCTCLLAAYQVVAGIDGLENIPTIAYTVGFGILLVACLLIIILGYDVLDSPVVVIVSTIIRSLSLGVVWGMLRDFASLTCYSPYWDCWQSSSPGLPIPGRFEQSSGLVQELPNSAIPAHHPGSPGATNRFACGLESTN
jgi:hypothetical protein